MHAVSAYTGISSPAGAQNKKQNRPCNSYMLQGRSNSAVPPCLTASLRPASNRYPIMLPAAFIRSLPASTLPARCCTDYLGLSSLSDIIDNCRRFVNHDKTAPRSTVLIIICLDREEGLWYPAHRAFLRSFHGFRGKTAVSTHPEFLFIPFKQLFILNIGQQ